MPGRMGKHNFNSEHVSKLKMPVRYPGRIPTGKLETISGTEICIWCVQ